MESAPPAGAPPAAASLPSPLSRTPDGAPACSRPTPACPRAADYAVVADAATTRGRYFCAEHVGEGVKRLRLQVEDTGERYRVVGLHPELPAVSFDPPATHPRLTLVLVVAMVVVIVAGFATLAPLMLKSML